MAHRTDKYVVDVEYTLPMVSTSREDPGGHSHAVHFDSKRDAARFIRALEKLISDAGCIRR